MKDSNAESVLEAIFKEQNLISMTLSQPKQAQESSKMTVRPLMVKGELFYQISDYRGAKVFHSNLNHTDCLEFVRKHLLDFKQSFVYTTNADYQILTNKKGQVTLLKKKATKQPLPLLHNRQKNYVLEEGIPVPFLIELGVMSAEGKVYSKKSDKFRQINRFLEMIRDIVPYLDKNKKLHIVDFGCGKAYLTFALYHYLKAIEGLDVDIKGLDLKADVIDTCQHLADKLGYEGLYFSLGDINHYQPSSTIDMVVTLHACDTATDAALEKAIHWGAEVILSVPCCQHELYDQVESDVLHPLLRHGILKERFAALVTDAARAQLLDILGYQTQLIEFIDLEHTPKNVLIRAIKRKQPVDIESRLKSYQAFKAHLHIDPSLERRFQTTLQRLKSSSA